jgi:adenylylsulfate kinase-like enzyme
MVVWLIGLAGAGKTTIGRALYDLIKPLERATVFLDGDQVRDVMGQDLGHSLEERRANGWRMCRLCELLDREGINVVCATLSQFHEQQRWNRETFSRYFEVFIDVPMDVLMRRDQKGLYSGARAGAIRNVVGVDMPFPRPAAPDLVIENHASLVDFGPIARQILDELGARHPAWRQRA